jgi:hypothetical protein
MLTYSTVPTLGIGGFGRINGNDRSKDGHGAGVSGTHREDTSIFMVRVSTHRPVPGQRFLGRAEKPNLGLSSGISKAPSSPFGLQSEAPSSLQGLQQKKNVRGKFSILVKQHTTQLSLTVSTAMTSLMFG